ncbi:hypothetical protein GXM_08672 [Nostoc sphaeroides CCNUC1]|uniref:Uncharacterized protein n=1 Tax=Nostoc sphaeroides CCNUC1 TaxID=2653204 RepID=A0A5P8WEJ0_9NOSO|nr:hypothetical protein GXM_08672 [Nostoc sphaeroides CCNUC1]
MTLELTLRVASGTICAAIGSQGNRQNKVLPLISQDKAFVINHGKSLSIGF